MISLNFNILNPFSNRWKCIANTDYQISKHKVIELQIDKTNDIIGLGFRLTFRTSHAGVSLSLALFGYDIIFSVYDCRHWDYDNNCWFNYEKNSHE